MITIVKFSATWCQPCKQYNPILYKVVEDRDDVELIEVDIEEDPDKAVAYGVQGVPYTVLQRGDEILGGFKGATTKGKLNQIIDSFKED